MFFLDLDAGTKVIRKFGAIICDVIYTLISKVYELFITVARLNILSSPQIQPIYQRVTMILTIVMVFYITFEFVKYTISPDTITDKEKGAGNILKRVIIVISLIALVPEIFTTAYKLQNRIIETQLISKVILGTSSTDYTTYGNEFSANTLNLFYYYDEDACSSSSAGLINECGEAQKTVTENLNKIRTTGDSDIVTGINLASGKATFKEVNPAIKFNGILAIIVGGFILYILVMYSIDVGTRYAQLIFLQVISPIAIMGYILPKKDGIFQKWGKQCITTYIDLFLRIAIINFVLLIVKVLGDGFESGNIFSGIGNVSGSLKTFTYIVLVMGLLVFAQRAPKLLGELFPSSGAAGIGMGLKAADRVAPMTARAIGATLGATKVAGAVGRRMISAHNRNKANGKHSPLTQAGREESAQRRRNRDIARDATQRRRNFEKDKDVIEEYKDAENNLKPLISKAKQELREAEASGDANRIAEARKNYDAIKNTDEFKRYVEASKKYASTSTAEYNKQQIRDKAENFKQNEQERNTRVQELANAQQELQNARLSGNQERITRAENNEKIARENLDKANKKFDNASKEFENEKTKIQDFYGQDNVQDIEDNLKQAENAAREQVIEDDNKAYQSLAGAAVAGVAGTAKIISSGASATKLEDITKKVQEGVKQDIKHVQEVNKYYDAGGTSTVDRIVQQVEKKMGVETAYQRTVLENKALEPKIKVLEAQSSLTKDVKSTADSAEDRLKDKIDELKLEAKSNTIKTGLKKANGEDEYAEVSAGETLGSVHRKYVGRASSAQAEADSAAKRLEEYETQKSAVLNQDASSLSGQELADYNQAVAERNALRANANEKSQKAADAQFAATQVQKYAARYEYTSILRDFASGLSIDDIKKKPYDGVAVEKVRDAVESLKVAKQNSAIVADLRNRLSTVDFQAFMSGKMDNFDQLDRIKTAAINAGNEYERELKDIKEQKRSGETSNQTAAQKAANDFNDK